MEGVDVHTSSKQPGNKAAGHKHDFAKALGFKLLVAHNTFPEPPHAYTANSNIDLPGQQHVLVPEGSNWTVIDASDITTLGPLFERLCLRLACDSPGAQQCTSILTVLAPKKFKGVEGKTQRTRDLPAFPDKINKAMVRSGK